MVQLILLIMSGVELNPGPSESTSTLSDGSETLSSDTNSASIGNNISQIVDNAFSFLHLNVQSIVHKIDLITAEYSSHDILSFTQSWLHSNINEELLRIPNYKPPYRRDRPDRVGGGVIVYVKESVNCTLRHDLNVGGLECVWLELKINNRKYLYGTFYIPPNSDQQYWSYFEQSIELALNTNIDIILTGDFNINQLNNNPNDKIGCLLTQFSLHQIITEPTYITEHSSSLLDLIIVSNPFSILYSEVGPPLLNQTRYHLPVIGLLHHDSSHNSSFKRKIFLYEKGDYDSYRQQLSNIDWDNIFSTENVDDITSTITANIIDIANRTIPNKIITVRKENPPWITSHIKKMIRRKNRAHRRAKKTNSVGNWEKYRLIRNKCNDVVRNCKQDYFSNISNKINLEKSGSRNWWNLVKSLLGSTCNRHSIPPLQLDHDTICDNVTKCELFNEFFCKQSTLDDTHATLPDPPPAPDDVLSNLIITETEVEDILKTLDTTKASGPDNISPRLLKEASCILKKPFCRLFNLSLSQSIYPTQWKLANVTPVFKKDNPSDLTNYRPISLISVMGKVMERCVYKHIYNFLLDNNIISVNQSGFTPGDSAINQLLYITNEFGKALDDGKEIRVVFCDISKAFDRVWHKGLLWKLKSAGIRGPLLLWIENYLKNRRQRVVINNSYSGWEDIAAGVPQGSILGPLFFILYINDIVTEIESSIKLFADDTSLYIIVDDPASAAESINSDLHKIHSWSNQWLVKFNAQKTETMTVSKKINKPVHPPLIMNNVQINSVKDHKHLGLIISDYGSWHKHIDLITKKAFIRINILRKFRYILDRKTLEKIYLTFIRSIVEYADVVWDNPIALLVN